MCIYKCKTATDVGTDVEVLGFWQVIETVQMTTKKSSKSLS